MTSFKHAIYLFCSVLYLFTTAFIAYTAGDSSRINGDFLHSILFNLITGTWILTLFSTIFHMIALPYCNAKVIHASAILNGMILILSMLITFIFLDHFYGSLRMAYAVDLMVIFLIINCQQVFIEALYLVVKMRIKITTDLEVAAQQKKFH